MKSIASFLDRAFDLRLNGTDVRTELIAGIANFLAVSYLLAVNPTILGAAGMPAAGVVVATALALAAGTLVAGVIGRVPMVIGPGMGINAFFALTVVCGMGMSYQTGLFAVLLESVFLVAVAFAPAGRAVMDGIPDSIRRAFTIGLGMFLALVSLQMAGLVAGSPTSLVSFHRFSTGTCHTTDVGALLAMAGFCFMMVLVHRRVRAAIPVAIVATWAAGIFLQLVGWYHAGAVDGCPSLIPSWSFDEVATSVGEFGKLALSCFDIQSWKRAGSTATGFMVLLDIDFIVILMVMILNDMIAAYGSLIGVLGAPEIRDIANRHDAGKRVIRANAVTTFFSSVLGVQATTPFLESMAGIGSGGRTGLASVFSTMLFLLAIPLAPIFLAMPGFAVAPAVMFVAYCMASSVRELDVKDIPESVPVFVTIAGMAFTASIMDGICLGIVSWTIFHLACGRRREIGGVMYVLTLLSVARYAASYIGVR